VHAALEQAIALLREGRVEEALQVAEPTVHGLRNGPRPNVHVVRPFKEALVARIGATAAARQYARMTGVSLADTPRLPIVGLQEFACAHGASYHELSPARTVHMPAVPVLGEPDRTGLDTRARSFFRCVIHDAVVSSKSNFVVAGNNAILDYQADELEQLAFDFEVDPIAFGVQPGAITAAIESRAVAGPRIEEGIPLVGLTTYNYWHWLIEFLPRLLAWRDEPGFDQVSLIVDQQMPPGNIDALRFFAGRDAPVVVLQPGEAVRVERLWTASMIINLPHWPKIAEVPPDALTVVDAAALARQFDKLRPALERIARTASGPERVYLKRQVTQLRSMVNTAEVEGWFAARGFVLVEMGDLDFAEQVRLMCGARVVVAPNGAALTNTLFARPGTSIGVLDNRLMMDNHWYAAVCRELGQHLVFLSGEIVADDPDYAWNASYRIDTAALPAFLASLLA
jgi:hypothetical protein